MKAKGKRSRPWASAARLFRRFGRDEKAVSAVEFAIVAVPFFGLLLATFETTMVQFDAEMLDQATAAAARPLLTGQYQTSGQSCALQKQALQNAICPTSGPRPAGALPSNFDCSKLIIDVRQSNAMNNLDESTSLYLDPSKAQFSPAPAGQNNVLRVIYPLTAMLPILSNLPGGGMTTNNSGQVQYNGKWTHILMGISVFRTEPYGAGGGGTC